MVFIKPQLASWVSFLVILLGILISCVDLAAQKKHRVTFEDLATLKEISTLDLAPNGQLVTFTTWDGDLWFTRSEKPGLLRNLGKGILPRWSPDSKKLAYYSSTAGTMQLWVRNIETDTAEQVTSLEGGINPDPHTWGIGSHGWIYDSLRYSWSPDSKRLVFASQVVSANAESEGAGRAIIAPAEAFANDKPLVLTNSTPPEWTLTGIFRVGGFESRRWVNGKYSTNVIPKENPSPPPKMVNQLFVVDIVRKTVIQLTRDEGVYFTPDWSPDGRTIVCASFEGRQIAGAGPSNIYAIDVVTGKETPLTTDSQYKRLPRWSPDGKWVGYLTAGKYHYQFVSVLSFQGGTPTRVAPVFEHDIEEFIWARDSQAVEILYRDGVSFSIANVATTVTGVVQPINLPEAGRFCLRASQTGDIAWVETDGTKFSTVQLLPSRRKTAFTLVDLNPQIKEWELGAQEVVRWKGRDGSELEGVLIEPVGFREGQRYPLIINAYPGLGNGFFADPMSPGRWWASRGYVVFFPDARTPHGWLFPFKTEKFDQEAKGPRGVDVMTEDVLSGVEALIRRGLVDPSRMALYGHSNGGAVVNQLVTKTNSFKCAVSVGAALAADWSRPFFLHTLDPSIPYIAGVTPWDDPQAYVRLSAIYRLDKVSTPMLLAVGDDDGDFLLNQIEMYNGLRSLGKQVTLLRYPGQGHEFTGWAMKDFWDRENSFLDRCLKE
jgi:dipeptidyl aminopeptidase/acylaminoacyl peptidase